MRGFVVKKKEKEEKEEEEEEEEEEVKEEEKQTRLTFFFKYAITNEDCVLPLVYLYVSFAWLNFIHLLSFLL